MALTKEGLFEYFHGEVERRAERRRPPLGAMTSAYLTRLLVDKGLQTEEERTLAEMHMKAAVSPPSEALRIYRELGDRALYTAGYFPESLNKAVSPDYYADMGEAAYARAAELSARPRPAPWTGTFDELARRFRECADLIQAVAERAKIQGSRDIVGLYELWTTTGNSEAAERLAELGVIPVRVRET